MSTYDKAIPFPGLSDEEAKSRLSQEGLNQLPTSSPIKEFFKTLFSVLKEPMLFLLLACGIIYISIGDRSGALVLFSFVLFVIFITLYQERKTEKALAALRDLSSPKAKVIRSSQIKTIESKYIVKDDIILLSEGERVPADAQVLACTNLLIDESLLTGESVPVAKTEISSETQAKALSEKDAKTSLVFSGTLVVRGQGFAQVLKTGMQTQMGQIGKDLASLEIEKTPLQKETKRLVFVMATVGITACLLVFFLYGFRTGEYRKGLLASLALAMSVLPEEIPMILTVFLALGAWRMSKKQVLTRRANAIEALGSTTVLCVDKTGTLTMNKMSVQSMYVEEKLYQAKNLDKKSLPPALSTLIQYSMLASQATPFDPMEIAFHELGKQFIDERLLDESKELVREYPLSPQLFAMTHVLTSADLHQYVVASKGAPEAIFTLCQLSEETRAQLSQKTTEMAAHGLRVLAVAQSNWPKDLSNHPLPKEQQGFSFSFLGLLGLADPVRQEAKQVIAECKQAGIRVVMITGDHPGTAKSIAEQIGLSSEGAMLTGAELDLLDAQALQNRLKITNLFVRVSPQQKLRLVTELKAMGEIVAMTGDGVNDAPALKAAHIGVAMGNRGTDVAREAAGVVLLDDNIASWTTAISMGRRIWNNVQKATVYTMGIHVTIAGLALIPLIFHFPLVLLPIQIAMLEMVIDPACSLIFEADEGEKDIMQRPPRNVKQALFGVRLAFLSILQGGLVLGLCLLALKLSVWQKQPDPVSRTFAFFTLMIGNLGLIFVNRSQKDSLLQTLRKPNLAFFLIFGGVLLAGSLVMLLSPLQRLFSFGPLPWSYLGFCFAAGILAVLGCQGIKKLLFDRSSPSQNMRLALSP